MRSVFSVDPISFRTICKEIFYPDIPFDRTVIRNYLETVSLYRIMNNELKKTNLKRTIFD